jgi:hypothetical protein
VAAAAPSSSSVVPVVSAVLAAHSAMPAVPAALAAPSAVPVVPVAPVAPPAPVLSVLVTPPLRSLCTIVAPLVPPLPPLPAASRAPSCLAQVPLAREDLSSRPLRPGVSPLPSTASHDTLLPYSAMAPLPAALAAASSEEEDVMAPPYRRRSCCAGASVRASAIVPGCGPVVAAASRTLSEAAVIDDDDDDNLHSGPSAVPRRSLPAPCTSHAFISCQRESLWLLAGTLLPAPDSQGRAEVGGVVLHGHWAEQEMRGPRLPCRFCIKKWKVDLLVVCEEDPRRPDRCTECRDDRQGWILVGLLFTAYSLHCLC